MGDIPYSEACKGSENLTPAYDTQQEIYTEIFRLLDDAIVNLSIVGVAPAVEGDLIYGGDPELWLKAAYALKARYTLHLSKINPTTAFADALLPLPNAFSSSAEDLQFLFYNGQTESNPFWQFMDQRADIVMQKTFIDYLDTISEQNFGMQDPRLFEFASISGDPSQPYKGADWEDSGDDASIPGGYYEGTYPAAPNSPVFFITFTELLFIKAECELNTNVPIDQVKTTLLEAVASSLNQFNAFDQAYIDALGAYIAPLEKDPLYKVIMTQKYIALYYQAETFVDWRRTNNIIGLQANPTSQAVQNVIPRRFPYSESEQSYNPANVPNIADNWVPVWWDVFVQ